MVAFNGFFVSPVSFFNQRSRSLYAVAFVFNSLFERVSFIISFCQLNSICFVFRLLFKKQTAQSLFISGLTQICKLSLSLYFSASIPSESRSTAITSLFVRIDLLSSSLFLNSLQA